MPTGKVLAVTDKNGGRFKVGNDWYGLSYDAKKTGAAFMPSKGDEVQFSTDSKGYVDNLTVQGNSAPVVATPAQTVSQNQAAGWTTSGSVKGMALMAAATLLCNEDPAGQTVEHLAGGCVAVAQVFERYLTGQPDRQTGVFSVGLNGSPVLTQAAAVVRGVPDLPF